MIHYIKPHYSIKFTSKNVYKIIVKAKISDIPSKNIPNARLALLSRQAKRDPLFAMAFIQWMAKKGERQSKNLQSLYKGYCESINQGNLKSFLTICASLIHHPDTDPFALKIATWILLTIDKQPIPNKLLPAAKFASALFPSLEYILTSHFPELSISPQEVTVPEIKSKHNAFPDLIKHKGAYYVCFREANTHVRYKDEGLIRILRGSFNHTLNKWSWIPSGLISKRGIDLRDPRFFVDSNNTLHVAIGGSVIGKKDNTVNMTPHIAILTNNEWNLITAKSDPACDGKSGQWIWRVVWNTYNNTGYGLSYGQDYCVNLVSTRDGISFKKVTSIALPPLTELNEGTLRFNKDGTAIALIRSRRNGFIAHASPSSGYTDWSCHRIPFRLGGPDLLIDENRDAIWVGTRHFFLNQDNTLDEATIVGKIINDQLIPLIRLPGTNDCSYPGLVLEEDGSLTVIYYASPSPFTSKIYICRLCSTGFIL